MRRVFGILFVAAVLSAACGDDAPEESDAQESGVITPGGDIFEVTWHGDGCTVTGRPEVEAGSHLFVVRNLSDTGADLYVSRLVDGHTFQDLLDMQDEPGVYFPKPDWVVYSDSDPAEAMRVQSDGDYADNERVWMFAPEAGEHAIYIWPTPANELWFCAPLQVT